MFQAQLSIRDIRVISKADLASALMELDLEVETGIN